MLRGWNAKGTEILLVDWQEKAVREMLTAWSAERAPQMPHVGRQGGKTVVIITAATYERHWESGHPLPDDPRFTLGDDHDEHLLARALPADPGDRGHTVHHHGVGLDGQQAAQADEPAA